HVFFSRDQRFWNALATVMEEGDWLFHQRRVSAAIGDQWVPYPVQLHASVLGIEESGSADIAGAQNFREWCDLSFGPELTNRFFTPYNTKLWRTPMEELSCDWVGQRVAPKSASAESEGANWGPNAEFSYPSFGGAGEPWRRLARLMKTSGSFHFRSRLVRLNMTNRTAVAANGLTLA